MTGRAHRWRATMSIRWITASSATTALPTRPSGRPALTRHCSPLPPPPTETTTAISTTRSTSLASLQVSRVSNRTCRRDRAASTHRKRRCRVNAVISNQKLVISRWVVPYRHRTRRLSITVPIYPQVHRKIQKPWYGVGILSFRIAIAFYVCSLVLLTTGLTLIILTSFGNIFLPMDKAEFVGPAIVVVAVLCFGYGIRLTYNAYKNSELSRRRLKVRFSINCR